MGHDECGPVATSIRRESDRIVAGRRHERLAQFHRGVRVFGGEVVRQTNFFGQVVSIFGTYYPDIAIAVTPAVTALYRDLRRSWSWPRPATGTVSRRDGGAGTVPHGVLPMDDGMRAPADLERQGHRRR